MRTKRNLSANDAYLIRDLRHWWSVGNSRTLQLLSCLWFSEFARRSSSQCPSWCRCISYKTISPTWIGRTAVTLSLFRRPHRSSIELERFYVQSSIYRLGTSPFPVCAEFILQCVRGDNPRVWSNAIHKGVSSHSKSSYDGAGSREKYCTSFNIRKS